MMQNIMKKKKKMLTDRWNRAQRTECHFKHRELCKKYDNRSAISERFDVLDKQYLSVEEALMLLEAITYNNTAIRASIMLDKLRHHGYSYGEIAKLKNISKSAVKKLLNAEYQSSEEMFGREATFLAMEFKNYAAGLGLFYSFKTNSLDDRRHYVKRPSRR